jgi:hypothetical protein
MMAGGSGLSATTVTGQAIGVPGGQAFFDVDFCANLEGWRSGFDAGLAKNGTIAINTGQLPAG